MSPAPVIVVTGPSGAGKGTLIAELLRRLREAAPFDDRTERGELAGVHKRSLCTDSRRAQA